jgi:2-desacetyl-2-hydroxyethyl bacteriochlorophyllide A dehydrogenase
MIAAVFHGVEDIRVEDVPDPTPGSEDVIVEVRACGICGSDLEYYTGRSPLGTEDGLGPLILGHEFAGEVVEVGSGVTSLKKGDRVAVNPIQSNAASDVSRSGSPNFDLGTVLGVSTNGAFAQFVRTRAEHAYLLPEELSYEQGAFVEMLAASLHAVERAEIEFGDSVVIYGPGPVGLSMVELAVARGATVIMVGTRDYRLDIAKELGASHVINSSDTDSPYYSADVVEAVSEANSGELAQRAIVATSVPQATSQALEVTGNGATIIYMGLAGPEDTVAIPLLDSLAMEKTIRFSWLYPNKWPKTIRTMRDGIVNVDPLITHEIPLADINDGINRVIRREGGVIKMMVKP